MYDLKDLTSTFSQLANIGRKRFGATGKLQPADLVKIFSKNHVLNPNLLSQSSFTVPVDPSYPAWSHLLIMKGFTPGSYIIRWKAKTTGTNTKLRLRFLDDSLGPIEGFNPRGDEFQITSDESTYRFTISKDELERGCGLHVYGSAFNVAQTAPLIFYDCRLEKVGGVINPALSVLRGIFRMCHFMKEGAF